MTSVLNVDTIADKAGTGPVALTKQRMLRRWSAIQTILSTAESMAAHETALTWTLLKLTTALVDNGTGDFTNSFSKQYS